MNVLKALGNRYTQYSLVAEGVSALSVFMQSLSGMSMVMVNLNCPPYGRALIVAVPQFIMKYQCLITLGTTVNDSIYVRTLHDEVRT